jgi:thiol-disulfide isomerase/thioredoxin
MKQIIVAFIIVVISISTLKAQEKFIIEKDNKENIDFFFKEMDDSLKVNLLLPKFCVTGNKPINNDSIKGYVTFISIWQVHCAPCVAETEALNNLYSKYKGNPKFKFISIAPDRAKSIMSFIEEHKIVYPVYNNSFEEIKKITRTDGFPVQILVRADGKIERFVTGGFSDIKFANEHIKSVFYSKIDTLLQQL